MSVTREKFAKGLISANVPMTVGQLENLMESLDKNKDDVVDHKELIDGEKLFCWKLMHKKLRKQSIEMSGRRQRLGGLPDILNGARSKSSLTSNVNEGPATLPSVKE